MAKRSCLSETASADRLSDKTGAITTPASIGCEVSELFRDARPGQPIWFDDGKIGGYIESVSDDRMEVIVDQVAHASARAKLRCAKGINVPETDLRLAALTNDDMDAMKVAVGHAGRHRAVVC